MGKVILVCGKICSGKSYYSKQLKDSLNAVIISPDEATYELINNEQGEFYNVFSERLNKYLTRKVGEIAKAGANVIFERGLWSSKDRKEIKEYYKNNDVDCEIHYVCVDDDTWKQNITERNQRVLDGNGGSDFYLDEGLMKKLESKWEEPTEDEYDVIYKVDGVFSIQAYSDWVQNIDVKTLCIKSAPIPTIIEINIVQGTLISL